MIREFGIIKVGNHTRILYIYDWKSKYYKTVK